MARSALSHAKGRLPGRFEDLVALMPPRAIHDEVQYDNTIEMLDRLTSLRRPTGGQRQYLETLSVLAEAYENERYAIDSDQSPVAILKHLLESNGMNASQLGELLGNRSLGSKILRGERDLSKGHIRTLAKRFKVSPALFL